jgi:uncharacterized protein
MHGNRCPRALVIAGMPGVVATVDVADSVWTRMVGLLGRTHLEPHVGLLITRCSSVHTCFMRFSIDVLFLSDEGEVVRVFESLRPFQFVAGGRLAQQTLEMPAGACLRMGIGVGSKLRIEAT